MIDIKNLTKSYGDFTALSNLNLHIDKGSIFGLVGINGSGKTTLIKHLIGGLVPDEGECFIDGQNVKDNVEIKQRMAYIPDELFFFSNYSLGQMGKYYGNLYKNWNKEKFESMVSDFGLKMNGKIVKFSKGMQKQAAFILAICTTPDVLILDEPIDGLDPIMRKKVWGYLLKDVADREMTVMISSHNLRELEGICDSIGILKNGQIGFCGKLDELSEDADLTLEEIFFEKLGGEENA